jgi:hypothetical protein
MVPRGVPNQVRLQQTPPLHSQKVPLHSQQVPPQQVPPQQVPPQQVPPQQVPHMRNEPVHVRNEQTKIPHAVTHVRSENVPQVQNQDVKKHKKRFFDFSNSMLYKICVVFSMILLLIIVFQLNRLNNILSTKK